MAAEETVAISVPIKTLAAGTRIRSVQEINLYGIEASFITRES